MLGQNWNDGGGAMPARGGERPSFRDILNPLTGLTAAQAKALPPDERFAGMRAVTVDGKRWTYNLTSALVADGDRLVMVPDVAGAGGRFLADPGQIVDLSLPIGFATADAAVLYTMPVGSALLVRRGYWGVTADFTGGASSAIGLSSGQSPHNVKGDLHGGAGGDLAATLVAAGGLFIEGIVGTDVAAGILLKGGATILFDRIVSVFAAGAGFGHVVGELIANPGA